MQLSAYLTRSLGRGRREARPVKQSNNIAILKKKKKVAGILCVS
jgi:hypothetical protein